MEAIIFVGLQASGKSSFYQAHFFRTHIRLNLDMLRTRHRLDLLLRACIEAKQPFVIDNTNSMVAERAPYIALARTAAFRVTGYYFDADVDGCLRRNAERDEVQRVPRVAVLRTHRQLQCPTLAEGFDRLFGVCITDAGGFVVEDRSGEVR